ncbi:MAG: hypothetical protein MZV70_42775 [Desulfobacterales bacterium]|nr:hypothetical protein [Desulfobacterales bacterium]
MMLKDFYAHDDDSGSAAFGHEPRSCFMTPPARAGFPLWPRRLPGTPASVARDCSRFCMLPYVPILGATYGSAAAVQPGPFQAYLISSTLRRGLRRTLPAALAPLISDVPIVLLVLLVLAQVPPSVVTGLRPAGGLFLLHLAAGGLRGVPVLSGADARRGHAADADGAQGRGREPAEPPTRVTSRGRSSLGRCCCRRGGPPPRHTASRCWCPSTRR